MFNSIAVVQKREVGRDTFSLVLSAGLLGGGFGLALLLVRAPERAVVEVRPPLTMVELALPLPGKAPAPAPRGKPGRRSEEKAPGKVQEASAVVPQVSSVPETPLVDEGGGASGDGPRGDGAGGDGSGDLDGGEGKVPGRGGGGGPTSVHWSEVVPKVRVQPRFPEAARTLGRAEESCVLRITVNESGEPESVSERNCPAIFREAAIEVAYGWRWYPLVVNGQPQRAQFDLNFVFRLKG